MSRASTFRHAGFPRPLAAFALSLVAAVACNNGYSVVPIPDGDAVCEQLVDYCAAPAAALGEPYQSCYDTGMKRNASACLKVEDTCVKPCYDANAALPPPDGEGGAAGAGEGGATNGAAGATSAGGASEGGAANGAAGETDAASGAGGA